MVDNTGGNLMDSKAYYMEKYGRPIPDEVILDGNVTQWLVDKLDSTGLERNPTLTLNANVNSTPTSPRNKIFDMPENLAQTDISKYVDNKMYQKVNKKASFQR